MSRADRENRPELVCSGGDGDGDDDGDPDGGADDDDDDDDDGGDPGLALVPSGGRDVIARLRWR